MWGRIPWVSLQSFPWKKGHFIALLFQLLYEKETYMFLPLFYCKGHYLFLLACFYLFFTKKDTYLFQREFIWMKKVEWKG
jgi:hypothetical protein